MTRINGKMINGSYRDMLCEFSPRPINNDIEYDQVQGLIDTLLDAPKLSDDQKDFLSLLGMLIERYEQALSTDLELRGVELIKALLDDLGLRQKALLPVFKAESTISAILNGQRRLTVDQIAGLANFFRLPHSYFFDSGEKIVSTTHPALVASIHAAAQEPLDQGTPLELLEW